MKQNSNRPPRRGGPPGNGGRMTRRELLKGAAGLGALTALAGCASAGSRPRVSSRHAAARSNLVRRENEKPGTTDWRLTTTRVDAVTKYRCPWIEGFCSRTSARAGERISVYVSTRPTSRFTLDIYRMGYYGGAGGRRVLSLGPFAGKAQPDPPVGGKRVGGVRWDRGAA